jgi:hypothetical protein
VCKKCVNIGEISLSMFSMYSTEHMHFSRYKNEVFAIISLSTVTSIEQSSNWDLKSCDSSGQ